MATAGIATAGIVIAGIVAIAGIVETSGTNEEMHARSVDLAVAGMVSANYSAIRKLLVAEAVILGDGAMIADG